MGTYIAHGTMRGSGKFWASRSVRRFGFEGVVDKFLIHYSLNDCSHILKCELETYTELDLYTLHICRCGPPMNDSY